MLVYVRGAGDIATGVAARLVRVGVSVVMADIAVPTCIRRTISFCEAIRLGEVQVEGIRARLAQTSAEALEITEAGDVTVVVDPQAQMLGELKPAAVVDAILAKRNLGTTRDMAPAVIAVGPGFTAPVDCDAVVETMRGHFLGRVITQGSPQPNTGVPGVIAGYGKERVIHSPAVGVFRSDRAIGDIVSAGDVIGYAGDTPMCTQIDGCLRGLFANGVQVTEGFKCADVDPRGDASYINYISDKATSVGGGKIELFALDEARELLAGGKSRLVRYTMGGENSDTGMIYGGAICLCYLHLDATQALLFQSVADALAYRRIGDFVIDFEPFIASVLEGDVAECHGEESRHTIAGCPRLSLVEEGSKVTYTNAASEIHPAHIETLCPEEIAISIAAEMIHLRRTKLVPRKR